MLCLICATQRRRLIQAFVLERFYRVCSALYFFKVSKFEEYWDISFLLQFCEKIFIMTKRQRNLLDMYTKMNSNTFNVEISDSPISQDSHGSSNQLNVIQKENLE